MSKPSHRRELMDTDGKRYLFNRTKFDKSIKQQKEKLSTKIYLIEEKIADNCHVSVDAVRNWKKGSNGVGSIDNVRIIAKVLDIDYHDLLISQDHREVKTMVLSDEEKQAILKVYSDCISCMYEVRDFYNTSAVEKTVEKKREFKKKMNNSLTEMHRYVDQVGIVLKEDTRYTLHRIIYEFSPMPLELHENPNWEDRIEASMGINETEIILEKNRDFLKAIADPFYEAPYLSNEIFYAEKIGCDDIVYPTEEEWELIHNYWDRSELDVSRFGAGNCICFENVQNLPSIVGLDLYVVDIKNAFLFYFPGVFEEK